MSWSHQACRRSVRHSLPARMPRLSRLRTPWTLILMVLCRGLDGLRQSGRAGADQRPPPARLLGHRARRIHSARRWRSSPSTRMLQRANAVLYYILTYGLTTIGAFGVVGVVERATGSDKLDAFLGLHKRNPLLAAVLLVLFLSLAGIPPLVGFWAKFNLFAAVLSVGARRDSVRAGRAGHRLQRRLALLLSAGAQARLRHAGRRRDTDSRRIPSRCSCCSRSPPPSSCWAASRRCCRIGSRASIPQCSANPQNTRKPPEARCSGRHLCFSPASPTS